VILVGAGPGDPGLITVRGAQALASADVVLYDYLASPQLLTPVPAGAELVCLGRHGTGRLMSQSEINKQMIDAARRGKRVVRLKGGDPSIFGRLAEELTALHEAGVDYEIVPGITTATAVSSYAGIPLTNREAASCVTLVTGQESEKKHREDELDYDALAHVPGTLVVYMGITTAAKWSQALMAHGKPPETPVAIVRRCSCPDQQTIHGTLGDVPELLAPGKIRPPAVVIIGEVAATGQEHNWFTARPLFGKTVLVTRPEHQAQSLVARLTERGARVLYQPAIEIRPAPDPSDIDRAIARLDNFEWIVFSSSNGVQYFMERLLHQARDVRALGTLRLAAIGPATVDALANYCLKADVCPQEYRAEALAQTLSVSVEGRNLLLIRASRGRDVLAEMLTAAGGKVEQVVAYTSQDVVNADAEVLEELANGRIDWVTVTSSAIARSLSRMFGKKLGQAQLVAISPLTADVLRDLGFVPSAVAEVYTTDGLIDAILAAEAPPVPATDAPPVDGPWNQ
jgi:uroporphyrinogen III methyltransferase/synthase